MTARLHVLFKEQRIRSNDDGNVTDSVSVELRKWASGATWCRCRDCVLETRVLVDGTEYVFRRKVMDRDLTDAQMQRQAIAEFDHLLAAHPTLGKEVAGD